MPGKPGCHLLGMLQACRCFLAKKKQKTDDSHDTEELYACVFLVFVCVCASCRCQDRRHRVEIRLCCVFPLNCSWNTRSDNVCLFALIVSGSWAKFPYLWLKSHPSPPVVSSSSRFTSLPSVFSSFSCVSSFAECPRRQGRHLDGGSDVEDEERHIKF